MIEFSVTGRNVDECREAAEAIALAFYGSVPLQIQMVRATPCVQLFDNTVAAWTVEFAAKPR